MRAISHGIPCHSRIGSISDELKVLIPKIINKILDNAEKTVVKGDPLKSRRMLDTESYLLYFDDKLNIDKYNILNAFYTKTKDIEGILDDILYNDSEYAVSSFRKRYNIRQKFKEGNFEGYPSYKKIYEEAITKINKLKSLYPFLENLSDLDPGSYFSDGKIILFSDCVCKDYFSDFTYTSKLIGVKFYDSDKKFYEKMLTHDVYMNKIYPTGVNCNIQEMPQIPTTFEKINVVSVDCNKVITKIDNDTLEPIIRDENYPTNFYQFLDRIFLNPDLEKQIMCGEYNIFN